MCNYRGMRRMTPADFVRREAGRRLRRSRWTDVEAMATYFGVSMAKAVEVLRKMRESKPQPEEPKP